MSETPASASTAFDIASLLCASIDWTHGELAASEARSLHERGETERAAGAFVKRLRARARPSLRYTPEAVEIVRGHADDAARRAAADAIDRAIGQGTTPIRAGRRPSTRTTRTCSWR